MKKTECSKCGSSEIYTRRAGAYRSYLSLGLIKSTVLTDFVCSQCGFVDSYVLDDEAKEYIKKRWEKAQS